MTLTQETVTTKTYLACAALPSTTLSHPRESAAHPSLHPSLHPQLPPAVNPALQQPALDCSSDSEGRPSVQDETPCTLSPPQSKLLPPCSKVISSERIRVRTRRRAPQRREREPWRRGRGCWRPRSGSMRLSENEWQEGRFPLELIDWKLN